MKKQNLLTPKDYFFIKGVKYQINGVGSNNRFQFTDGAKNYVIGRYELEKKIVIKENKHLI